MSARSPNQRETAQHAWAIMRAFVESNSHNDEVRKQLGLGLGVGRVRALLLLREGPLSLVEIAEAHGVDAPYATVIVDKLEALGLVVRAPSADDRRRKLVTLTPAGCDAAARAEEALAQPPDALAKLSAAELTQLDALVSKLT